MLAEKRVPMVARDRGARAAGRGEQVDPDRAWAPFEPGAARPWNLTRAAHLFRRAGFGADWGRLQRALVEGPRRSVETLVHPRADLESFQGTFDDHESSATDSAGLRSWWLRRMMETPHPLLEKMTLFWHHHFAIGNRRVQNPRLMRQHVSLLRTHALGSFDTLLEGVSRDPAYLISLDARANRKSRPAENHARSLLELHTLGPNQGSDGDVRELARAFTGWFVLRGVSRYVPREHDSGVKLIRGRRGKFTAREAVRVLLRDPATPRFLVRKLYRWLISETGEPDEAVIAPLAESFGRDHDIGKLVETMLRSNLFFSSEALHRRIKSPLEYALGIVRGLEGIVGTSRLGRDLAALGQDLHEPPTIRGWAGGRNWINRFTVLGRSNLALDLLSDSSPHGKTLDPLAVARKHGHSTPEAATRFLVDLFLQAEPGSDGFRAVEEAMPAPPGDDSSRRLRRVAHLIVTLPEFHLA